MARNCPSGIAGLLLLAAACAAQAAGEGPGGYRQDYDFPDQGDAWYGGMRLPQQRRDFAAPFLDRVLSGEDFCAGYERRVDPFGFGPPLFRTNQRNTGYAFGFAPADEEWRCLEGGVVAPPPSCNDGNRCTNDWYDSSAGRCRYDPLPDGTSCSDGVFCDGPETCQGGSCTGGAPPSCDDGDGCTEDACDPVSDTCRNVAPPIPEEVTGLAVDPFAPGEATVVLHWNEQPLAEFYNVYRSTGGDPGETACLVPGVPGTSAQDDGALPPRGQAFYFLSTAANCAGESSLGEGQPGPRPNESPCD